MGSRERTVFQELTRRLALRRGEALLHPAVPQEILDAGDACFAVARRGDGASLVALHNLTAQPQRVKVEALRGRKSVADLIEKKELPGTDDVPLAPYQCRWLLVI